MNLLDRATLDHELEGCTLARRLVLFDSVGSTNDEARKLGREGGPHGTVVLADQQTATDIDFAHIEAIIAHEYFHNWTGNRITCRDWFQLTLKEGPPSERVASVVALPLADSAISVRKTPWPRIWARAARGLSALIVPFVDRPAWLTPL